MIGSEARTMRRGIEGLGLLQGPARPAFEIRAGVLDASLAASIVQAQLTQRCAKERRWPLRLG